MSGDELKDGNSPERIKRVISEVLKEIPGFETLVATATKLMKEPSGHKDELGLSSTTKPDDETPKGKFATAYL